MPFWKRCRSDVIVVLDEAYLDFVRPDLQIDARRYLDGGKAVVALRTFSKAYGLAGLRIGYGLMHEEIAGYIHRVRQPFNVNQLAQVGTLAALDDEEHYRKTLQMTWEGMHWLFGELRKLGAAPPTTPTPTSSSSMSGWMPKRYTRRC